MKFTELSISGAFIIDMEPIQDHRGYFSRVFCQREFRNGGLSDKISQCSVAYNLVEGTLRGLHYQLPPKQEIKVIRCIQGAVYDVIVDLRQSSPTYCQWYGCELTAENGRALYISEGLAHGYITLVKETTLYYQMSQFFDDALNRGVRYDDPAFGIHWPIPPSVISEKDSTYPDYIPS